MALAPSPSFTCAARKTPGKVVLCTRRTVGCSACPNHNAPAKSNRRVTLLGLGLASIPILQLAKPDSSWALLPDDDDSELVEKAKASRKQRLREELATERKYVSSAGFKSKSLEKALVPIQKAVFELAKSGSQLMSGDLSNLAGTISGPWLSEFESASQTISSGNTSAEKLIGSVYSGINALSSAANQGDVTGSKKAYVATIAAFESWASAAGVDGRLKGL